MGTDLCRSGPAVHSPTYGEQTVASAGEASAPVRAQNH